MRISEWLAQEWARQIGPVLSSMTGEAVQAAAAASEAGGPAGEAMYVVRRLRESPDAVLRLAVSPELCRMAGEAVLQGAGLPASDEAEVRNAFLEALQQALGQLAASLGRRLGREVSWEEAADEPAPAGGADWAVVEISAGEASWGKVWLSASAGFAGEGRQETGATDEAGPAAPAAQRRPMLELLMEVELPVGVTFGRTQLRLKDAIKLTSGSIVELNRSIIEPVEVIVNNCVIARGEVVVVEGNYGVRIQEIVSREERLRTLF